MIKAFLFVVCFVCLFMLGKVKVIEPVNDFHRNTIIRICEGLSSCLKWMKEQSHTINISHKEDTLTIIPVVVMLFVISSLLSPIL